MMFLLRWPLILILLAFVAFSLFPAAVVTALLNNINVPFLSPAEADVARNSNWIEAGLWYGAAVFLLIAAIRLMRQTQAFWAWLMGFALYGARWALVQGGGANIVQSVQGLTADSFKPDTLASDPTSAASQIALLAALLLVGLLVFIVDHGDRRYWDKQAAG